MNIFQAIRANNLDRVNLLLLRDNQLVKIVSSDGNTLLGLAAAENNTDIGQALINHGADVNGADQDSETPLMIAASLDYLDFVRLLLKHPDINVNAKNNDELGGDTALLLAVRAGSISIVELLLNNGADPNINSKNGFSPLMLSLARSKIVELLLQSNLIDVNAQDKLGVTAFNLAVGSNYSAAFKLLLARPDVDIDLPDFKGVTPLMVAALNSSKKTKKSITFDYIGALLDAGADPLMLYGNKIALDYAEDNVRLKQYTDDWTKRRQQAIQQLDQKFIVARRLRQGTQTRTGSQLELPSKDLTEGLIRKAEYDHLCKGLQSNLTKPGVIALARSLRIKTSNQTKIQLCAEIAGRLTI